MFLVMCELIDKLSESLGGDHDGVDPVIGDRLNKVIVGFNKGSKHMVVHRIYFPHSKTTPPQNANLQSGPKFGIKVRLDCNINLLIVLLMCE